MRSMATLASSKAALRKQVEERIASLSQESKRQQSKAIIEKLFNLPVFKRSHRISVFLSTENEVDTEPIVRKIFEDNKECFVPRYTKSNMEMVKLLSMQDWETLPLTSWKIKQPSAKEKRENALETGGLDLIIMPGVAFTKNGHRLGHGGGYYDKYLQQIKQNGKCNPETVAVAFKEQIYSEIPVSDHDVKIDMVLTDDS